MNKGIGIALLVVGIALIIFGFSASDSVTSGVSRAFTGAPTDKTLWLLLGGSQQRRSRNQRRNRCRSNGRSGGDRITGDGLNERWARRRFAHRFTSGNEQSGA